MRHKDVNEAATKRRVQSMGKRGLIFILAFGLLFSVGCASTPKVERFSLIAPAKDILSSNRFVIAPVSLMEEYVPSGDEEVDKYLDGNGEMWQSEIASCLSKEFSEKGIKAEIIQVKPEEFKERLSSLLKKNGREGFFDPNTGSLDAAFLSNVMGDIAGQYNATLIAPHMVLLSIPVETSKSMSGALGPFALIGFAIDLASSPKVKWDGVSRSFETGGAKFLRVMGTGQSASIDVLSLYVEGYGSKGREFWSRGGFDIRSKVGATEVVKKDVDEIFKGKENLTEAVRVAFDPLFSVE